MHEIGTIYRVGVRGSSLYIFSQIIGQMLEIQHSMIVVCERINSCHQLYAYFFLRIKAKSVLQITNFT